MQTIFISIYDGDTEKNVLRSGTFDRLKKSGNRIVLLVRAAFLIDHYKKDFESDTVFVESLPPASNMVEQIWYFIGWNTLPTRSAVLRRHMSRARGWPLWRFAIGTFLGLLGRFRMWRNFLRLVYGVSPDSYAADLFEKYKPDVFFSPNMFSPEDSRLLRQAKRFGVPTIATAKSWDVLTTKAFTRVRADRLLVFNEFNRQEAIDLGDYAPERVTVTGFPQFDAYAHDETFMSRETFFHRIGADLAKRLIMIAVPGDWKTPHTKEIMAELDRRIEAGRFKKPIQVLARFHPKYQDSSEGMRLKHFIFDRPGTYLSDKKEFSIDMGISNSLAWTFTDKDVTHLANSLRHSDMVLNTESTVTLDAAANDRPVILIGYDGDARLPYWNSIARVYEREHYRHVTETGAAPLATSHDELEAAINAFLEDPEYKRTEREILKRNMLFQIDGRATERVAQAVLGMMREKI